ncbi:MAG: GAF domain-containing protein [bacterium]|nr:GAF domain-containing protein [bacterium]
MQARGIAPYGIALLAVGVATVTKLALDPVLGGQVPFILYFGAVVLSAWAGGVGPGLAAAAASGLMAALVFAPPPASPLAQLVRLGIFLAEGALISLVAGRQRADRDRLAAELAHRRAAQQRLVESESRFRAVVESNMIGILFWHDDGRITDANDALLRMLGYDREALARGELDWRTLVGADRLARHERALDEIHMRGVCAPFVSDIRRRDGSYLPILCAGARVRPGEGVSWLIDRTAQQRAEDALRETAEILDTVNQVGQRLVAELDVDRLVQSVTDAAVQASGARFGAFFYNKVDAQGESYTLYTLSGVPRDAFARFPLPRNTALFGPTFRGEGNVRLGDVRRDARYGQNPPHRGMPEGHLPVASYLAVPVVSRDGAVLGGLFFGHPEPGVFTERAERVVSGLAAQAAIALDNASLLERERGAREAAEAATRVKDEFLSVLSHELRTPLTAILNWLRALRREADPTRITHGLAGMERAARAQSRLIEDLLDVSRIVAGRLRLEPRPVDVRESMRAAVEMLAPTAEAKGVTLRHELPDLPLVVAGDPHRLQQIAWNLLSNAVKFTPRGGEVCVAVVRHDDAVRIVVHDSGCGIPSDFVDRVFDRFVHREAAATRREGGLGLGLAIVRHLVELHGGRVEAASDGDGRGATFTVTLPAAEMAAPATLPSDAVPDSGASSVAEGSRG